MTAIAPAEDQLGDAVAAQGQQFSQPEGMQAGQYAGLADRPQGWGTGGKGGNSDGLAPDAVGHGAKGTEYGPLGTGGDTDPAGIAAAGVDAQALVVQDKDPAWAGINAGTAGRLFQVGMNATARRDLGCQGSPGPRPGPARCRLGYGGAYQTGPEPGTKVLGGGTARATAGRRRASISSGLGRGTWARSARIPRNSSR